MHQKSSESHVDPLRATHVRQIHNVFAVPLAVRVGLLGGRVAAAVQRGGPRLTGLDVGRHSAR